MKMNKQELLLSRSPIQFHLAVQIIHCSIIIICIIFLETSEFVITSLVVHPNRNFSFPLVLRCLALMSEGLVISTIVLITFVCQNECRPVLE